VGDSEWCQPSSEVITHQYVGPEGIQGKHAVSNMGGLKVRHVVMRSYAEAS